MAINAVGTQPLTPLQPPVVEDGEMHATVQPAPKEKMERTMYKLIKLMAELQSCLLELNKEINIQKSDATKEMMQAYKDCARQLRYQAFSTGGGLIGGGITGSLPVYFQVAKSDIAASMITSFGQVGSDIGKKPFESYQRVYEGSQRKFEQLSQELGQTTQSTTAVIDGISDKLQGAMRNAAPAA